MRHGIKLVVFTLVLLLAAGPSLLFADLEEFKEGVEKEEAQNRTAKEDEQKAKEETGDGEGEVNPFLRFLYQISIMIWTVHNGSSYYDSYPYGAGPNAFLYHDLSRTDAYVSEAESYKERKPVKTHWFELSGGVLATEGLEELGGMVSLQGRFSPYIGPDIDYRLYADGSNLLQTTGVGLDLPLVQSNPFSWSAYGKYTAWRGALHRDGISAGFTFRSYLFNPVSIYLRTGGVFFSHVAFGQVEGRLNIHLGRVSVFGGVNLLESESKANRLLSFEAGSSIYF